MGLLRHRLSELLSVGHHETFVILRALLSPASEAMDDGFEDLLSGLEESNPNVGASSAEPRKTSAPAEKDFDALLNEACGDVPSSFQSR